MGQVKKSSPGRKKQQRLVEKPASLIKRIGLLALTFCVIVIVGVVVFRYSVIEREIETRWLALTKSAGFQLEDVVVTGRQRTSTDAILDATGVAPGDSLLTFDLQDIQEKIKALPWVYDASVRREFPNTLTLGLVEREPLLLWQSQNQHHLIDQFGEVVPLSDLSSFSSLLVVSGEHAPEHAPKLMTVMDHYDALKPIIRGAQYMRANRWDLYLVHDICVKLPEENMEKAMARLVNLHEDGQLDSHEIMAIDLRDPEKLTIRMTPAAAKKYYKNGQDA